MTKTSRSWDAVLSQVENRLSGWSSPDLIAALVGAFCFGLLSLSVLGPADILYKWPHASGMGQNTLLALLLFALTLRFRMKSGPVVCAVLCAAPPVMAGLVILQTHLSWLPPDGWYRMLMNTAPDIDVWRNQWPGRMSVTEAQLLLWAFLAGLLLRLNSKIGIAVACALIAAVALVGAARSAAFMLDITTLDPASDLSGTVNPLLGVMLFFVALALSHIYINHPVYLAWENRNPGQSAFLKVGALLNMLLVAAATATLGYARQGQIGAAAIVLLLLSAIALLVIYVRIVSVVEERRRAELTLKAREAALEKAQAIGRLGSWRLLWPQGLMEWSQESYRIFGVEQGGLLTLEAFMKTVHPDDLALFQQSWNDGLAGAVYDIEHRILVGRKIRWVRERADFQWNASKTVCECLGTVQDITDSKTEELELLRSRELIRKLAAHNEEIREQERIKIARELHDEMGQHLTALRLQTSMVQMQLGGGNEVFNAQLQDIKLRIDNTIGVVRSVAASLRPPALDAGLVAASQWMLENYVEQAGIATQLESDVDEFLLSDGLKTTAFRIIQESLTNVIKHSAATKVLVWITQDVNELTISITDNGVGFSPDKVDADLHFGLIGIKERVLNFQGSTSVESAPGKGCCISVTLPLGGVSDKQ